MKTRRRKVTLIYLGGAWHGNRLIKLDLCRLAKKLNSLPGQSSFHFMAPKCGIDIAYDLEKPQSNEFGKPDYRESKYLIGPLLRRLNDDWVPHTEKEGDDLAIGILRSPLTHDELIEEGSKESTLGEDYFSQSDFQRCAVITTHRDMLELKPKGKSSEQYVSYLIAGELVNILSRNNRMHPGDAPCLMNDCVDRALVADCMDIGGFCSACAHKIRSDWRIAGGERGSLQAILLWCKKDTWGHSVEELLSSPLKNLGLLLSSVAPKLAGAFGPKVLRDLVTEAPVAMEFVPVVAVFVLLLAYERYKDRRSTGA